MKENEESSVDAWIEKADHDLGAAKLIFLHVPDYYDVIAFHCQQAVEKYFKAALIHFKKPFKKTHNLVYLLDLFNGSVEISEVIYKKSLIINSFGAEVRYPELTIHLTKAELEEAIIIADELRTFAIELINKK